VPGGNEHLASKVADPLVETGEYSDRREALHYLLNSKGGNALLRRLRSRHAQARHIKSTTVKVASMTMKDREAELRDLAKGEGIYKIAKAVTEDRKNYGLTEHEFCELLMGYAKRNAKPGETAERAFARIYCENTENGSLLRKALATIKTASWPPTYDEDDAYRKLQELAREQHEAGKFKTFEQAFASVYASHPDLAAAERRQARARLVG
jgi:hypothetical protein